MKPALENNISRKLVTIQKNMKASEAYALMANEWIRHLPVVDDKGEMVIGMISDRDVLRASRPDKPVAELMSSPVRTFDIGTPIRTVVTAMIDAKMSAFLITERDEIVGIITSEDMLLLLAQLLKEEASAKWILSEFLVNPLLQKTVTMTAQAGI
ncbi:MAG: CBS domain-containing protein [Bdellovibrio sp.]